MKRTTAIIPVFLFIFSASLWAQMTADQKITDFMTLAATVSKNYAFVEWKRTALQYDALKLSPWLAKIQSTTDDESFWKICSQYIASLQDSHSVFVLPSTWTATLGFSVDIYDGKVYVDSIDPRIFPPRNARPVQIGDEIAAIDGQAVADLISDAASQVGDGNSRSGQRFAAALLVNREQDLSPERSI